MPVIHFDLNDIENEPSDEALASLMEAVAEEARRKQKIAREQLMERLQKEIEANREKYKDI
jgi:hypothetical protein